MWCVYCDLIHWQLFFLYAGVENWPSWSQKKNHGLNSRATVWGSTCKIQPLFPTQGNRLNLASLRPKMDFNTWYSDITINMFYLANVYQIQDLLSQNTSPLSYMDPYTSRSMDMLLPFGESGRKSRALDQDGSISLRSFGERSRSHVSTSVTMITVIRMTPFK